MNEIITKGGNTTVTMTSMELVERINQLEGRTDLTHANFMAKAPKVLGVWGLIQMEDTYIHPQNGQRYPCYRLPKREACLMAMSYSYDLQAKVFDRMTELEAQTTAPTPPAHRLPQTYHEALVELTHVVGMNLELKAQATVDAPKVEFAMAVRNMDGACKLGDYGKAIGIGRTTLFSALRRDGILMAGNLPYQRYLDSGWFTVAETMPYLDAKGKSHPSFCTLVTGKGQVALQRKYAAQCAANLPFQQAA